MSRYDEMEAVMALIWRLPASEAGHIVQSSAFKMLVRHCEATYPSFGKGFSRSFALLDGLRAVGLPCEQRQGLPPVDISTASRALVDALELQQVTRRYLAPLHLADELPSLQFGDAWVTRFTPDELRRVIEFDRLVRQGYASPPDIGLLSQLQWLVVEHTAPTPGGVAARGSRLFQGAFEGDPGAIEPYEGRYPKPMMDALFALLLQPWEDWHGHGDYDWRAFSIPWVHVATGDIFDRAQAIPPAADLAWEPHFVGDEEVGEKPVVWNLDFADAAALSKVDDTCWSRLEKARRSTLFQTPVEHFLLQGYLATGMDEIIAHMISIEAAVGLRSDFGAGGAKKRVTKRVGKLLNDGVAGNEYGDLVEVRSQFVHGRAFQGKVPSVTRNQARVLARRVANALVDRAQTLPDGKSREEFLNELG
ncbi:hypothetical protein [Roseomonas mucosa]|uniref:hypothetical protein n=1 Tax=Roseomonas mucosa TaxID=207340 RepID=UPI0028CFA353|nr:hypothetical protein [Roseomonas mucosa]MDT8350932.1 hypothetical protein [Roseomonas mucosa]